MGEMNPLTGGVPEFYRLDPTYQYVPGEFGIPTGPFQTGTNYGKDPLEEQADLSEVRLGTDDQRNLWMLACTTTMNDTNPGTAVLVLLATRPVSITYKVPFNSGHSTSKANIRSCLHGSYVAWSNLT